MEKAKFCFEECNYGEAEDRSSSSNRSSQVNMVYQGNDYDCGIQQYDLSKEEITFSEYEQQEEQQQSFLEHALLLDRLMSDILSPPLETCLEEITKCDGVQNGIVGDGEARNYGKQSLDEKSCTSTKVVGQELSTTQIMQIAGARFIMSSPRMTSANNPVNLSLFCHSDEQVKNVELVEYLLASAEKTGYQQFDRARRLLRHCQLFSSSIGNPVQRVVHYFSEALRERIDIKTGRIIAEELQKKKTIDLNEALMIPSIPILSCYQKIPFGQVLHFVGIQTIVDNVADAKRIHVIDLGISTGVQWTILMQALVCQEKPPELLKVTAIGTSLKQVIEDTGKRLTSFAESVNLPFSFKVVMISDWLELKEDLIDLKVEETVAVFSQYLLRSMVVLSDRLDSIMRVMRKINPRIMVVAEVEANHNSPAFVNRFIESLFYFGAYFDCLEAFMERDDPNRMVVEALHLGERIRNMVATEGEERKIRNVKLEVWRAFFSRFGMVETELSESSLYQAKLVGGRHCTLNMNGKSLICGWKGTPLHSLSAWKFISERLAEGIERE